MSGIEQVHCGRCTMTFAVGSAHHLPRLRERMNTSCSGGTPMSDATALHGGAGLAQAVPKTIRVRIAVAVQPDGVWCASGDSSFTDTWSKGAALHALDDGAVAVWVEADVPLPETAVVEGRVVGEESAP